MIIIGCDYHPGFQQIAFVDTETGELQERRLQHREEAEKDAKLCQAEKAELAVRKQRQELEEEKRKLDPTPEE